MRIFNILFLRVFFSQIPSIEGLRKRLNMFMEQYNELIRGGSLDLVFFKDAMIHLVKVCQQIQSYVYTL